MGFGDLGFGCVWSSFALEAVAPFPAAECLDFQGRASCGTFGEGWFLDPSWEVEELPLTCEPVWDAKGGRGDVEARDLDGRSTFIPRPRPGR